MHALVLVLHALLAASGALATAGDGVSHPHKRAAALRDSTPKLTRATGAPDRRASSDNPSYLTPKTQSESNGLPGLSAPFPSAPPPTNTVRPRPWDVSTFQLNC